MQTGRSHTASKETGVHKGRSRERGKTIWLKDVHCCSVNGGTAEEKGGGGCTLQHQVNDLLYNNPRCYKRAGGESNRTNQILLLQETTNYNLSCSRVQSHRVSLSSMAPILTAAHWSVNLLCHWTTDWME